MPAKLGGVIARAKVKVARVARTVKKAVRGPVTKASRRPVKTKWPPAPARVLGILETLAATYPDADCELHRENPFQLLCATILSAQCTDERVNMVTPTLFSRFPDAQAMSQAPLPVLEEIIRSTGFYRQKAKNLKETARLLLERHGGTVPRTIEQLITLPGVARKTSNVVLGTAYGIASGVVVDTHVQRLSMRLGITRELTPEKIERDLIAVLPQDRWIHFSHQLIWHGRRICFARKPACDRCPLVPSCPSAFKES